MDKKVTEKADMFGRVKLVCKANMALVESIPMLKTTYDDFIKGCTKVEDLKEALSLDNKGLAIEKHKYWSDLAFSLEGITNGLQAFAKTSNDEVLYVKAAFSVTAFKKLRGDDAVSTARALIKLTNVHIAALEVYNVSPEKVTAATKLTDDLAKLGSGPITNITTDKAVRKMLFEEVAKVNLLLAERMDKLVRTMRLSEPLFFDSYQNARKMRHPGLRHRLPESEPTEQAVLPATEAITQALSDGSENMKGEVKEVPVGNEN